MLGLVSVMNHVRKGEILDELQQEVTFSYQYFSLLILSVVISTFGLLIANTAIIIGAMILSPLIWPIIGISIGTVTSHKKLTLGSLLLLVVSIAVSVLIAYFIAVMSPIVEVNSEVALRINPTFFDLLIALAAGTAAILIVAWPKYSNSLAGVAVAASVLPPICVTGIGLALGSFKVSYGSFVLFLTNTASIIFVGIVIFVVLGFFSKSDKDQVKTIEVGLVISFMVILLLSFQLVFSLSQILYVEGAETMIKDTLDTELKEISTEINVDNVKMNSLSRTSPVVDVEAGLRVPSDVEITVTQKNNIVAELSSVLDKKVNLEFRIVPVLKVVSEQTNEEGSLEDQLVQTAKQLVTDRMSAISQSIIVESVTISQKIAVNGEKGIEGYKVDVLLRAPVGVDIGESTKNDLVLVLIDDLKKPVELNIRVVRFEDV